MFGFLFGFQACILGNSLVNQEPSVHFVFFFLWGGVGSESFSYSTCDVSICPRYIDLRLVILNAVFKKVIVLNLA